MGRFEARFRANPLFGLADTLADNDLGAVANACSFDGGAAAHQPDITAGRAADATARAFATIDPRLKSRPPPRFAGLYRGGNAGNGDVDWSGHVEESAPYEMEAVRARASKVEAKLAAAKRDLQTAEREQRAFMEK